MARILFCWELGGALGHLATVQPLAARLAALGHEVHLATSATRLPRGLQLSATFHTVPGWSHPSSPAGAVRTYAHVLRNVGYDDPGQLASQLRAWRRIFQRVRPDVIVFETSPTAMLASRGLDVATVAIGTGFSVPPPVYPLPDLHHWEPAADVSSRDDEDALTSLINDVLRSSHLPAIEHLHDVFSATCTAVCSVPELDAYDGRPVERYVGELAHLPGERVDWPGSASHRVFAYLKSFPELPQLLKLLRERNVSALIYAPGSPREFAQRFRSPRILFAEQPLDVSHLLRTASLVITHGHGLILQSLQAGVPVLCLPLLLDQHIVARRVAALKAGSYCSPWGSTRIGATLDSLLTDATFTQHSLAFRARYSHFHPETQATQLAARIASLAG